MKNLQEIAKEANIVLSQEVFAIEGDSVINRKNRYEGNDLNLRVEEGKYILTLTGVTESYDTPEAAVQGLVDMYSA